MRTPLASAASRPAGTSRGRLTLALAAGGVALSAAGSVRAEDERLGAEYIDVTPEQVTAERAAAEAEAVERGDTKDHAEYLPGYRRAPSVGLSPYAPQVQPSMPGALMPSFGAPVRDHGWRFDFQGYLQAVMRASIGTRDHAIPGQKRTTLHGDPVVPGGSYGWFDHTLTVPTPWSQLNFLYGNETVRATAIIGAWSVAGADEAAGNRMPQAQVLFANAFLTYTPDLHPAILRVNVGAYPDRYGAMAEWHEGAYGASLIGSIYGVGTTATLELPYQGGLTGRVEAGFKGELDKPPVGIVQNGTNEHARDEEGSTYAVHGHVGLTYKSITPTLHLIHSFSQDDRIDLPDNPLTEWDESHLRRDGSLGVRGADVRIDGERFGYFYLGAQRTLGNDANAVSDLVKILNAGSGKEFNEHFWGFVSRGNGALTLVGSQYTLSLGRLLRHPMEFWGEGPDLTLSAFGIYGHADSDIREFDDQDMVKVGVEGVYSFSKYVAASMRVDQVNPDLDDLSRSFGVISPKLIIRSGWVTRESLTLQYARYVLGDNVRVEGDNRLVNIMSSNPDRDLVALYGTIWW